MYGSTGFKLPRYLRDRGVVMRRGPDPAAAHSPAEFTELMRRLRRWADLSYRQLERNATNAGDVLPRATISAALARDELPREELLAAYVRACGGDDDTVAAWLDARRRLAISSPGTPPSGQEDLSPGDTETPSATQAPHTGTAEGPDVEPTKSSNRPASAQSSRGRWGPQLSTALLTVAGMTALALWPHSNGNDGSDGTPAENRPTKSTPAKSAPAESRPAESGPTESTPAESGPPAGLYRIHPVATYPHRCLDGTGEGSDSLAMVVEWRCTGSKDQLFTLEKAGRATYRIRPQNTIEGAGPWCAEFASSAVGALWVPALCRENDPRQHIRIQHTTPARDIEHDVFMMRGTQSATCVTVDKHIDQNGIAEVAQRKCLDSPGQQFVFIPSA